MKARFALLLVLYLFFGLPVEAGTLSNSKKRSVRSYKIAVCDWMVLKRQKIGVFELVKGLGADGVELDMGGLGKRDSFDNKLRQSHFQVLFNDKAKEYKLEVPSIAMSGFYAQSFVDRTNYVDLVADCLNTMKVMGAKVAFLPLGVQCDLNKRPEIRPELVKRLKRVGDMAWKEGLVIGIETSLDAKNELALLREINSKGIKIYYNFQNALVNGRNLYNELQLLGKDNICQIHCTDTDGVLLKNNTRLDMAKVKRTLDRMKWNGWLVVERSRDTKDVHNVKRNYGMNVEYLKCIFK